MKYLKMLCWLFVMICSIVAGLVAIAGVSSAQGAPQEAAVMAAAIGIAVIPYCFARALSEIGK